MKPTLLFNFTAWRPNPAPVACDLGVYRTLRRDPRAGSPLRTYGEVHQYKLGYYWTVPVDVPVMGLLACLDSKVYATRDRLADVKRATVPLPPIEVGVYRDGSAWLVDGNHRLQAAMDTGRPTILTRFTFVGQDKPLPRTR